MGCVHRLTTSLMQHGRNNGKKMLAVWFCHDLLLRIVYSLLLGADCLMCFL